MSSDLAAIKQALRQAANPEKAVFFPRFFKAGPGQYAEGDKFLGVTVPEQRKITKRFADIKLTDAEKLLKSPWHEERLTALFILVSQYLRGDSANKKTIYEFYVSHTKNINNWDLVDSSAGYIVGMWLQGRPEKMEVLQRLAASDLLWERRIAMIATLCYIKQGTADEGLIIAKQLLYDKHNLIQKAVGWMLREVGKRCDRQLLTAFLDEHAATMPRTTLRYVIEHLAPEQKKHYLGLKYAV